MLAFPIVNLEVRAKRVLETSQALYQPLNIRPHAAQVTLRADEHILFWSNRHRQDSLHWSHGSLLSPLFLYRMTRSAWCGTSRGRETPRHSRMLASGPTI